MAPTVGEKNDHDENREHEGSRMADRDVLDFRPGADMTWEIRRTDDRFETMFWLEPTGPTPPLHVHPHAEESYEVLEGSIEVNIEGDWRKVPAGERAVVPVGARHTLRPDPDSDRQAKLINAHTPGLDYESFFRKFHQLASTGGAALPPKDPRSLFNVAILFSDHPEEIRSVRPPQRLLDAVAFIGRRLGYGPDS